MTKKPVDKNLLRPVFLFDDYRVYLKMMIEGHAETRGFRTRLAEAAACQPSYLTQVLGGTAGFSLDQLHKISCYLEHSTAEWDFLRELCLLDRAGSAGLKEDCRRRLEELRSRHGGAIASMAAKPSPQSLEDMTWYASSLHHGMVFCSLSAESSRRSEDIARARGINPARCEEVLRGLEARGFALRDAQGWRAATAVLFWRAGTLYNSNRDNWLMHGQHRRLTGYEGGLHVGGLSSVSRAQFETFRAEIEAEYRKRMAEWCEIGRDGGETVAFFGIDYFEA